jgi:hypothetical protein
MGGPRANNIDDFMYMVSFVDSGCWEWQGGLNKDGYGIFNMIKLTRSRLAHRICFAYFKPDEYSDDLFALHKCDNPKCVNPEHLYMGDNYDNAQDRMERKRFVHWNAGRTHCKNGHEFNEENTYWRPEGKRTCRTCDKARRLKIKLKKKENENVE